MQKLKLSSDTLNVLKSFYNINPQLLFKEGKVISTCSPTNTVIASFNCEEEFQSSFGIYKLDKFLGVLSLFNEPELEIHDKFLVVKKEGHEAKVAFADPKLIISPKKAKLNLPSVDVELKITQDQLNTIVKSFNYMELPAVAFVGDGETLSFVAINPEDPNADSYTIELGKTDKTFKAVFKTTNLKMIPMDYNVKVCAKGFAEFSNDKLTYYIAVENKESSF